MGGAYSPKCKTNWTGRTPPFVHLFDGDVETRDNRHIGKRTATVVLLTLLGLGCLTGCGSSKPEAVTVTVQKSSGDEHNLDDDHRVSV